MAHFAKLDENNIVTQVIVISNNELLDENGQESEQRGIEFCKNLLSGGKWVQTSYNRNFRKKYAGIGFKYDEQKDAFIPKKPHASWALEEETYDWKPPIPRPNDGNVYAWDETTISWKPVPKPFPSWIASQDGIFWIPPIPIPQPNFPPAYRWDEDTVSWIIDEENNNAI